MAALIGVNVTPKSDNSGYVCRVPLDLLSEDGVPPAEGDSVSYSVDGTVQSVDAENANIKIESVNGQPVDESSAQEAAEDAGTSAGTAPAPGSSAAMRPGLAAGAGKGGLGMF
jgi:hypothetical protein